MQLKKFLGWLIRSNEPRAQNARRVVKLIILFGLFAALFWIVPVSSVIQVLRTVDPGYLLIGVGLGFVALLLTSVQLLPLVHNQGIRRSLAQIFEINLAVKFYLLFTPSNLIASGIRWYRFAQPEGKVIESFVALAFFRLFDMFLTLTIGLSFLLLSANQSIQVNPIWVALPIVTIIIAWVVITRYSLQIYRGVKIRMISLVNNRGSQPGKWAVLKGKSFQVILAKFEKLLSAASAYADMPGWQLLGSILSGTTAALVGIASGVILAMALGIDLGFLTMGWIQSIVSLTAQLPFAMAEGLGVREVTLVAVLSLYDVTAEQALALSFLIFTRSLIIALIGGVLEAVGAFKHRRVEMLDPIRDKPKEL
jgi:uncharacterized protein (TIRG00374 family)